MEKRAWRYSLQGRENIDTIHMKTITTNSPQIYNNLDKLRFSSKKSATSRENVEDYDSGFIKKIVMCAIPLNAVFLISYFWHVNWDLMKVFCIFLWACFPFVCTKADWEMHKRSGLTPLILILIVFQGFSVIFGIINAGEFSQYYHFYSIFHKPTTRGITMYMSTIIKLSWLFFIPIFLKTESDIIKLLKIGVFWVTLNMFLGFLQFILWFGGIKWPSYMFYFGSYREYGGIVETVQATHKLFNVEVPRIFGLIGEPKHFGIWLVIGIGMILFLRLAGYKTKLTGGWNIFLFYVAMILSGSATPYVGLVGLLLFGLFLPMSKFDRKWLVAPVIIIAIIMSSLEVRNLLDRPIDQFEVAIRQERSQIAEVDNIVTAFEYLKEHPLDLIWGTGYGLQVFLLIPYREVARWDPRILMGSPGSVWFDSLLWGGITPTLILALIYWKFFKLCYNFRNRKCSYILPIFGAIFLFSLIRNPDTLFYIFGGTAIALTNIETTYKKGHSKY